MQCSPLGHVNGLRETLKGRENRHQGRTLYGFLDGLSGHPPSEGCLCHGVDVGCHLLNEPAEFAPGLVGVVVLLIFGFIASHIEAEGREGGS